MSTDDLGERVLRFQKLQLPGQPQMMHMGTSYLVNDLWREVQRLRQLVRGVVNPTVDVDSVPGSKT